MVGDVSVQRISSNESSIVIGIFMVLMSLRAAPADADGLVFTTRERMVEGTVESRKTYADPFNEVDVDVVFTGAGTSWRVPMFWHGGQRWTVRFSPPQPGEYEYRLESTDTANPDLNGLQGRVRVEPYRGSNELLRHGNLRVSANKRFFEHADGTPFYWLGDTWWTGLSDRLSWEGFQKLTADRKAKGFTVVQIVAGLVPLETAPSDPGSCNEGGCVWDEGFKQINPRYFDSADRRIQLLIDNGLVPAIVGAWRQKLQDTGVTKMQKHWRYIIARYGAYPVFWVVGGEVFDPPEAKTPHLPETLQTMVVRGWTDVTRYVRRTDPYRHPLTAHELPPPLDIPLQDESLTDFDLVQSSQFGWSAIAISVSQINLRYARTYVTKPVVQGEIGYENHVNHHFEDFQRTAFWLSMLNGAAGHTYGADATWGAQTGNKRLHRHPLSFRNWEEGMNLAGSYQVGLGAKLMRQYPWWEIQPHPEWVSPRGTTLLSPRTELRGDELGSWLEPSNPDEDDPFTEFENYPRGEWQELHGNFRRPYAAGIPGKLRLIYIPTFLRTSPTVLGLESTARYHAYLWEPSMGIKFDLGSVQRPALGATLFQDQFDRKGADRWLDHGDAKGTRKEGTFILSGPVLSTVRRIRESNVLVTVDAHSDAPVTMLLRYQDDGNYVAAVYSPSEQALYLLERKNGADGRPLGKTAVPIVGRALKLSAEVRDGRGAASISDGEKSYTTRIVDLSMTAAGSVGLLHRAEEPTQTFANFALRRSVAPPKDRVVQTTLVDAQGNPRGDLRGWEGLNGDKHILLDAYQPPPVPAPGDWLLVLSASTGE